MAARVGIDFDNTLVRCDPLFERAAGERGLLPAGGPATKEGIRDHLRRSGREDAWTELQGRVYGVLIRDAPPFPGAREFLARCRRENVPVCVISHKTRVAVRGEPHDLHKAAREWLETRGFCGPEGFLSPDQVFLETSRDEKLRRIAQAGCTHFIDDLEEVFREPAFPAGVRRWLFAPGDKDGRRGEVDVFSAWDRIAERFFREARD